MSTKPVQDQEKYVVRFPEGMRDRLKDEAAKNGRSLNAEIIHRLESTLLGMPRHTSLDDIAETFIRKVTAEQQEPELLDQVYELLLRAKRIEADTARSFFRGALKLMESGRSGETIPTPDVHDGNWNWDELPKDNLPVVPKSPRQPKKRA